MKKYIDYIVLLLWTYTIIVLPSFLFIRACPSLFQELGFFVQLSGQIPEFATLLLTTMALPGIGMFLLLFNRRLKLVTIWKMKSNQILFTVLFSLLLSYTSWNYFRILYSWGYFGLVLFFLFFLFYLPQVVLFLDSVNFGDFKIFFSRQPQLKCVLALSFLLLIHQTIIFANQKVVVYKEQVAFNELLPQIKKGEPHLVYRSNIIILYGNNFGIESGNISDNTYADTESVNNQFGKVNFTFWDNNKIIFQVPLHWKTGEITVWIEKQITWKSKRIKVKSNRVRFKLMDTTGSWDKADDEYFRQLKHLDKETLRVNGYNSK